MRDDDTSGLDRPDALDDALHKIFLAALDLRAELRYAEDLHAAAHIHAAIALLDGVTRELRLGALDRRPDDRLRTGAGTRLFIAFHDEEP